jgi:peptidoglycan/xylan/chitin deacetylase (PgdA/CDA1 family)
VTDGAGNPLAGEPGVDGVPAVTTNITVPPSKKIALTFDDGPHPTFTPLVLDVLEQFGVQATFFAVGEHVDQYQGLAQQIIAEGHLLENHSYDHANLTTLNSAQITTQLQQTSDSIFNAVGVAADYFRPPYGATNGTVESVAVSLGMESILWTVDTNDWRQNGVDGIIQSALGGASDNGIILMHDGGGNRQQTVDALDDIIIGLQSDGYQIVTLDELFATGPDTTAPTVNVTAPANTSGAYTVTFGFSEVVANFDVADLVITNGAAGAISGSGSIYTAVITPTGTDPVSLAFNAANDIIDTAGNALAGEPGTDGTPPVTTTVNTGGPTKKIALTFDDGPNPTFTPQVLDVLEQFGVQATFFGTGETINANQGLAQTIVSEGHLLGNLGFDHTDLTTLTTAEITQQLQLTTTAIVNATGTTPDYFRPAFGSHNSEVESVGDSLGLDMALWTVDTNDWQQNGVSGIIQAALSGAADQGVIIMHDGGGDRAQTVDALDDIIIGLQADGYEIVTLDQITTLPSWDFA